MKSSKLFTSVMLALAVSPMVLAQEPTFTSQENVTYGQGAVVKDGKTSDRELKMDVFIPNAELPTAAIFMTFGGSFHRGNPHLPYNMEGAQTTSMREYCKIFVEQGYACFNIDYRVAPELPIPHRATYKESAVNMDAIPKLEGQVNIVRSIMNLERLDLSKNSDQKIIENAILSGAEDLQSAVRYVKANADTFNIDADKIILGGFSAGAIHSINVSHGMQEPVAGTMMLGTAELGFNLRETVRTAEDANPILMFLGQYDLPAALAETPALLSHYKKIGVDYEFNWVPGAGHFYPSGAVALDGDGIRLSVEERMLNFVERVTQ
ncbi:MULTISPECIES: alpha/beta hydrolase [Vibrio]|uniref:alpha/beta hydrolase n=1 Tax=Vibrio TaxID=662 RepID=UPI00142F1563|nr:MULTISPECIES: dienelactone hydrolase family protein [Vibrio]